MSVIIQITAIQASWPCIQLHWGPRCCWGVGCSILCSDAGCCLSSALDGAHGQHPPFLSSLTWISEGRASVSFRLQNLPGTVRVQSKFSTSHCFPGRTTLKLLFITWELLAPNNGEWKRQKNWLSCCRGVIEICTLTYYGCKTTWEWNSKSWMCKNDMIKSIHALYRQLLSLEMSAFLGTESCVRRSLCSHKSSFLPLLISKLFRLCPAFACQPLSSLKCLIPG